MMSVLTAMSGTTLCQLCCAKCSSALRRAASHAVGTGHGAKGRAVSEDHILRINVRTLAIRLMIFAFTLASAPWPKAGS